MRNLRRKIHYFVSYDVERYVDGMHLPVYNEGVLVENLDEVHALVEIITLMFIKWCLGLRLERI